MSFRNTAGAVTSPRSTVVLICLLSAMLFLNVSLPQERVVGEERFSEITEGSPAARFVLDTLGLGRMSVSPVFLGVMGVFFIHLTAVLVKRTGVTFRRTRPRPPSRGTLESWTTGEKALRRTCDGELDRRHVLGVLKGFGYRAMPAGEGAVWSVKHRTAPLGFLLFHLSFFLICLGGAAIYYTRFVGTARVVEGHRFTGFSNVIREAPLGGTPQLQFVVQEVDARFDGGRPVHLSAQLRFLGPGGGEFKRSRINHPAHWGSASVMVNRAGLAPQLWLQDLQGFTLARIAVAADTMSGRPTVLPLGEGRWQVELRPLVESTAFPDREALAATPIGVKVTRGEEVLFDGTLRSGQDAVFDDVVLVLHEVGYWVALYVVAERGGGLLIAGFLVGTIGLMWRLMLYRREVAVVWEADSFAVAGRAEYFSNRFRQELETIATYLERGNPQKTPQKA
jgi:hypothetical protein